MLTEVLMMEARLFNKNIEYWWEDGEKRYIDDDNREWIWTKLKEGDVRGKIAHHDVKNDKRYFGYWNIKR